MKASSTCISQKRCKQKKEMILELLQSALQRENAEKIDNVDTQCFKASLEKVAKQGDTEKFLRWSTKQYVAMQNQKESKRLKYIAIPSARRDILRTAKLIAEAKADPILHRCPLSEDKRRQLKRRVEKLQDPKEHYYRLTNLLDQLEKKNALTEAMRSAANMNDVETIKQLLTQGVGVNTFDEYGFSAVTYACKKGYNEALNAMIEHADLEGSCCNTNNDEGNALIISTRNKHFNVTKLLLRHGVNIDARDKFGRTALLWACAIGSLDLVKLLLEYGSKVDVVDNQGNTCLRLAVLNNDNSLNNLLLDRGAH